MRVMTATGLWRQNVNVHPPDSIEISEAIDEGPDTGGIASAEDSYQAPLPLVGAARRRDDLLKLVLDLVEGGSGPRMVVVERYEGGHLTGDLFQSRVGLDILAHRLSHRSRSGVESFVLPGVVELREQVIGNIEAGAHVTSFATGPLTACYYVLPAAVLTAFLPDAPLHRPAMCHHFESVDELTEQEREELVEEHDLDELRAEHSEAELETLGVV